MQKLISVSLSVQQISAPKSSKVQQMSRQYSISWQIKFYGNSGVMDSQVADIQLCRSASSLACVWYTMPQEKEIKWDKSCGLADLLSQSTMYFVWKLLIQEVCIMFA